MSKHKVLVSVHCYAGDKKQVLELRPFYEHHNYPIVIVSPVNSQVHGIGPHICRCAGGVGYIGQVSWDRQYDQMKMLLEYDFDWYLMHDADSVVIVPELPEYLFEDDNVVYSNEVDDFRKPGGTWEGIKWPDDYHKGYPIIAMQPPYFMSRNAIEAIVATAHGMVACPITPFIDWQMVPMTINAGLKHSPFQHCASCETKTTLGQAVMAECVTKRRASFIHSIKTGALAKKYYDLYHGN